MEDAGKRFVLKGKGCAHGLAIQGRFPASRKTLFFCINDSESDSNNDSNMMVMITIMIMIVRVIVTMIAI